MLKTWILALAMALAVGPVSYSYADDAADEFDVFLDEGDGDFDSAPVSEEPASNSASTPLMPTGDQLRKNSGSDPWDIEPEQSTSTVAEPEPVVEPEPVAQPAPAAEKKPKAGRKLKKVKGKANTISNKRVTGRFMVTTGDCPMMRKPASKGSPMLVVRSSKKIWTEDVNQDWVRAYNQAGEPGYLSRTCFE